MIERKGCHVLLEAARELRPRHPSLYFAWIGTAAPNQEIEARIDEYGLRDSFRTITSGEIGESRLDLLLLLRLADLFVLPSLSEGLPVALLEAMALGKACIASGVNAIPEAIRDHETGVLVQPGDPKGLAEAITGLQADTRLRERLASAGQAYVLSNFDERIAARTTVDFYDACSQAV
jgi:glycosyltransferase involved in cell wall biosynthesis